MRTPRFLVPVLALLAACSGSGDSKAQSEVPFGTPTRSAPADAASMKSSFAPVVRRAAPAVVNVYARRLVRQRVDPFWELFGGGVPRARVEQSLGSGVIVRADGVVVTNNHVVEGGQEFMVVLADRRELSARLLLADPRTDLAVLKIEEAGRYPTVPIDTGEDLEVGDLVLAIGNPFGVGQTVTNGIISALNRTAEPGGDTAGSFIQTDAAINPGNSGGALVDMDGDLIGINSFILSRSGTSSGVGFAVPGAMVRRVVETAVGGGRAVVRPWLGADVNAVTGEIARSLGLDRPEGVLVAGVWPGGPAARAGVREGDIIVSVDGAAVNDEAGLNYRVATRRPGETADVVVLRNGRRDTLRARVEAPPASPAADERVIQAGPLAGATVVNLSPALADELGADPFSARGVLIRGVTGRSYAAAGGFRPGDLVRAVNGRPVTSTRELQQLLAAAPRGGWTVTIVRDGREVTGQFR
ncbi:MAG TPA: Do family serine endopeptidase [Caulobacteraceae bacterium]|nr:Do family serine endopeptidase [Caulobacteraceae bacterium]